MQIKNPLKRKSKSDMIVERQLTVMGNAFSWISAVIILVTIVIGVFSFLRIESLGDKLDKRIERQDELILQKTQRFEDKFEEFRGEIDKKIGQYETNFGNRVDRFTDKSEQNMKDAITNMNKDFEKLSGESALKPHIDILYNENPLNGKVIEITMTGTQHFDLHGIYLKNTGSKVAEKMVIRLSFTYPIFCGNWYNMIPNEGFHTTLYWKSWSAEYDYITPGDKWNTPFINDDFDIQQGDIIKPENMPFKIGCKLEVLYEAAIPAIAEFTILLSYKK